MEAEPYAAVISALEAAVAAAPDNIDLLLQLAVVRAEVGRHADALTAARGVLAARPDDAAAADVAARSAAATGDSASAARFRRLAAALGGVEPPEPETMPTEHSPPTPKDVDTGLEAPSEQFDAELDAFLRDVLGRPVQPILTLSDVGGLEDVKRFLAPMRDAGLRAAFRKSLRGGLLLYGPPGCGKTFLARAVAGELRARFISVGLGDVVDMWYGKAVQNLQALFDGARRAAPCVVFFDEIDALGQKRGNLTRHAGRDTVAQLLTELDGLADNNEGVFVLGATNRPWDVDEALRRPGRFDRVMLVLPPDAVAREAILATHLKDRPVASDVKLKQIAACTDRFSGADLALAVESATEMAMEASAEAGEIRPITTSMLIRAAQALSPSTLAWFETARNYALYANQSGTYDDLLAYIRANRL